jgi:hypothetical protein
MWIYISTPPIRLHGVQLNQLSTWTTLPYTILTILAEFFGISFSRTGMAGKAFTELRLQTSIRKLPGSHHGWDTGYPD